MYSAWLRLLKPSGESYRELVTYLGNNDPTTQRMIKEILAMEEEHADDMASLLEGLKI